MNSAQASTEYLLVIGGALAVLVLLTLTMLSVLGTGQAQTECNFDAFETMLGIPDTGVQIVSPTTCSKAAVPGSGTLDIKFNVGKKVTSYDVIVKNIAGNIMCETLVPVPISPTTTPQSYTYQCVYINAIGGYDIEVTVFYGSESRKDTEAGAINAG